MDSFLEQLDSVIEGIPDDISSFVLAIICLIYVLIKVRKGKKKAANSSQQGNSAGAYRQNTRQVSQQYRPQPGQQVSRQTTQQYRQQAAQSYNRQGGVAKYQSMPSGPQAMLQRTQAPARFSEPSAMPHTHRPSGVYDTFNRRSARNDSGTMPHKHEEGHYTSMMDVSKLPKGYILLNGEPVRVADLEDK